VYDHDWIVVYHNSLDASLTSRQLIARIIAQRFGAWKRSETQEDGREVEALDARPGDLVRLRIVNAIAGEMPGAPLRIAAVGGDVTLRAIDAHDLNRPGVLGRRLLAIGMGQRFDLVFRVPPDGPVVLRDPDWEETVIVGTAGSAAAAAQDVGRWQPLDLGDYGEPAYDPIMTRASFDATCVIDMASAPGHRDERVQLVHTMNGQAFPNIPMLMVTEGVTRARSGAPSGSRGPPARSPWRSTTRRAGNRATRRLRTLFDRGEGDRDPGRGPDPDPGADRRPGSGSGLRGIRERVTALGGRLRAGFVASPPARCATTCPPPSRKWALATASRPRGRKAGCRAPAVREKKHARPPARPESRRRPTSP